jgi:1,4-alpha-glucan branching enzyme
MRLACPHCHQVLEIDEAWAGHEVACPLCGGAFVIPAAEEPVAAAPETIDPPAPPQADPPQSTKPAANEKLKAWNRQRRIRQIVSSIVILGLLGGAGWGFNQWRGERPPLDALRDAANSALEWISNLVQPPKPPAPAPTPTPTPTPEPTPTPTPTPEPTPEPTPTLPDPVSWLMNNVDRWPKELVLRQTATFPDLAGGKGVKVPSGRVVSLVNIEPGSVEVRFLTSATVKLPLEATNLGELAAQEMAKPAPTPEPQIADAPTPTPAAVIPKTREDQLGAMLQRDKSGKITGTTFRVWAPNAEEVSVVGSFNSWRPKANEMSVDKESGVWSVEVPRAKAGDEYMFLINGELERRDPRGRQLSEAGKSVINDPTAFDWEDTTPPATKLSDLVIYQLHPGTFHDPSPDDGKMATLRDAIGRLDHLKDLGVNCVLLMPVSEFSGNHSWGYNPTDPYAIERAYGGPDALREFIREAHRRGIAVHIDVVHNHYHDVDVHLRQFDGYGGGDNQNGIYFYEDKERGMTDWGPRPNFGQPQVKQYIADNIRMFFDEYRADGLRWDSVANIVAYNDRASANPEGEKLVDEFSKMIRSEYPGKISIAEDAVGDDRFDGSWEYGFHHAGEGEEERVLGMVPQLVRPAGETDVADIAKRLQTELGFARVVYTENHDETAYRENGPSYQRLIADADEDDPHSVTARRKSALAAVLTLTAPGVPFVFMGQELLETKQFHDSNPIDWDRGNISERSTKLFKDLIHLRRNLDGRGGALQDTNIRFIEQDTDKQLLAYRRYLAGRPEDDLVVIINFSPEPMENIPVTFPRPAQWELLINTDDPRYGEGFTGVAGKSEGEDGSRREVTLAPFSAQIYGIAKDGTR